MGTNYYLRSEICPHCGRSDTSIHIGKSSAGWRFLFRRELELASIVSWPQWQEAIRQPGALVENEYGEAISADDFIAMVEAKQTDRPHGGPMDRHGYCFSDREFS